MTRPTHCDRPMMRNGKDRQGYQRWRCRTCGASYSENPSPSKGGRPTIGDERMPSYIRQRRFLARRKKKDVDN